MERPAGGAPYPDVYTHIHTYPRVSVFSSGRNVDSEAPPPRAQHPSEHNRAHIGPQRAPNKPSRGRRNEFDPTPLQSGSHRTVQTQCFRNTGSQNRAKHNVSATPAHRTVSNTMFLQHWLTEPCKTLCFCNIGFPVRLPAPSKLRAWLPCLASQWGFRRPRSYEFGLQNRVKHYVLATLSYRTV